MVRTHNGIIFDNIEEKISYSFDRNDVYIEEKRKTDIFMAYGFLINNMMNYYERSYKTIIDLFSSIGGIYNVIIIIITYINSFYNQFIELSDTEILLYSLIDNEKINFENKKKYNKINDIKNSEKEKNKEKVKEKKNKNIKNSCERKINNNSRNYTYINNSKIEKTQSKIENSNNTIINEEIRKKSKLNINENKGENIITKENIKIKNEKYNFFHFLLFKITCGKKNDFFNVYNNFGQKIISEEYLIKNNLHIYNLLKINKRKINRRNSFKLKDLINFI